jgi:hypothetical protein
MRTDRFRGGGFVRRGKPVLTSLSIGMWSGIFWFDSEPSILERDVKFGMEVMLKMRGRK